MMQTDWKEPPADLDAEQMLLAELVAHPAHISTVAPILRPEDFADPVHAAIYEHARDMAATGGISIGAIWNLIRHMPEAAELGGKEYLKALATNALGVMAPETLAYNAGYIAELSRKRELIGLGQRFAESAFDTTEPVAVQIAKLEADLAEIQSRGVTEPHSWAGSIDAALADYEQAYVSGGAIQGLSTGFAALDETLGGLEGGNLYVLAARPGMGKTALAGNILYNAASAGASVAFFSLEMPEKQIAGRIVCTAAGLPFHSVRRGLVQEDAFERLMAARDHVAEMPITIDARSGIAPSYARAQCEKIKRQRGLDLVIVDYVQLMTSDVERRGGNRTQEITDISNRMKALAMSLNVPVVLLSQLNRSVESRDDKRPTLSDLRESGAIEQDADAVMFIYREEYYLRRAEPDPADGRYDDWLNAMEIAKGKADIDVAKNRHGPEGRVQLRFNAPLMRFADAPKEWKEQAQ